MDVSSCWVFFCELQTESEDWEDEVKLAAGKASGQRRNSRMTQQKGDARPQLTYAVMFLADVDVAVLVVVFR